MPTAALLFFYTILSIKAEVSIREHTLVVPNIKPRASHARQVLYHRAPFPAFPCCIITHRSPSLMQMWCHGAITAGESHGVGPGNRCKSGKTLPPRAETVSISLPFDFLMFSQSRDRLVLCKGKWSVVGQEHWGHVNPWRRPSPRAGGEGRELK